MFGVTPTVWGQEQRDVNPTNELPPSAVEVLPDLEDLNLFPDIPNPVSPDPMETESQPDSTESEVTETFTIDGFAFEGNTVFENEELTEILNCVPKSDADQKSSDAEAQGQDDESLAPAESSKNTCVDLIGTEITFADLSAATAIITQYYFNAGYVTSGAVPSESLLDDAIDDGIVNIQVVEGTIAEEDIRITGLNHLQESYVRRRLRRAIEPINQDQLLEVLQLLQLDPLISRLNANLRAGAEIGRSILDLDFKEAKRITGSLTLDNGRSPSVGTLRRIAQVTHQNLLGYGDQLAFAFTNTDGSNSLDSLSYTWPLDAQGTTLAFSYSRSRNAIIEEPFDILDITSRSLSYQLTYRQPLYRTPNTEIAVGAIAGWQESQSFLGLDNIGGFPFSAGADKNGSTRVSAVRLFGEYNQRSNTEVFAVRSQLSFGLPWFNASQSDLDVPDSQFFSTRTQVQYLRLLAPDVFLLLRSDLQWTPQDLLSLEEFSVGGAATVRGYRQDELLADNGFFASAELRFPLLKVPSWQTQLQLAPFFDIGTVWNDSSTIDISPQTIYSVGMGLNLSVGNNLQGRLDWGLPLVDVNTEPDSLQENGVHFSLNYRF